MRVDIVETPELGDRSYVISDGLASIVVDPQRDLDRVEDVLVEQGTPVTHVLETHVHNDYLSGGYELARRTGASYGLNASDEVAFERQPLRDGDQFRAGALRVQVIATPGHTPTHLTYLIDDELVRNPVYRADSEQTFVDELIASLGAYPSYYAQMAPLNRNGPAAVDFARPVPAVGPGDLRARLANGTTVVDIRAGAAYAAAHLPGSISINYGDQLATYVGWLIPFGAPIILIGDSPGQLQQARRQLARIGFGDVTGTSLPISELGMPRSFPA
ncbi:MAG TPA: MBL fold metallo-hydrolase [Streptosporangiaceae bacterium]|jgi:rhodanese-related sulfurtransferase